MFTELLYKITSFQTRVIFRESTSNSHALNVLIADTGVKRALGLMHRKDLGQADAMLFIFKKEGKHDIWMLNMKFSLDILWLDSNGKVLKIIENVPPCPKGAIFKPEASPPNSRYVLEFNAGAAKTENIIVGTQFHL